MRNVLILIVLVVFWPFDVVASESRVVYVSLDGGADFMVDDLLVRGVLSSDGAFGRMLRNGVSAEYVVPVNVSATAVCHAALYTGASPGVNGVVANGMHFHGEPVRKRNSGFVTPLEAEPLWRAAMRQGLNTICATAAHADGKDEARQCTLTLGYGQVLARPATLKLAPTDDILVVNGFERLRRLTAVNGEPIQWKTRDGKAKVLNVYAVDQNSDNQKLYSGIALDFDEDPRNGIAAVLEPKQWASLPFELDDKKAGARVYLEEFEGDLSKLKLYLGAVNHNPGGPDSWMNNLYENVGIWPGDPDFRGFNTGRINHEMFMDQNEALAQHIRKAVLLGMAQPDWRLLFTYLPLVDHLQHFFLVRDPRQADYHAEDGKRRARYARIVEQAYVEADRIIAEWMDAAPEGTHFVLASDHGMAPTHNVILINKLLAENGFDVRAAKDTALWSHTTGPSAHIYLNLKGRQADGVVDPKDKGRLLDQIEAFLKGLVDPVNAERLFPVVARGDEIKKLGLYHPTRSGDLFVSARAGWSLSGRMDEGVPVYMPVSYRMDVIEKLGHGMQAQNFLRTSGLNQVGVGVHGGPGDHPLMHAVFYAYGPNLSKRRLGSMSSLDVAPTIAGMLGIEPPKDSEGVNVLK